VARSAGGGASSFRPLSDRVEDCLEHLLALIRDLVIPKSNHSNSASGEPRCPLLVAEPIEMTAPIDLDAQLCRGTIEVDT
jgi:hypothetical protein